MPHHKALKTETEVTEESAKGIVINVKKIFAYKRSDNVTSMFDLGISKC